MHDSACLNMSECAWHTEVNTNLVTIRGQCVFLSCSKRIFTCCLPVIRAFFFPSFRVWWTWATTRPDCCMKPSYQRISDGHRLTSILFQSFPSVSVYLLCHCVLVPGTKSYMASVGCPCCLQSCFRCSWCNQGDDSFRMEAIIRIACHSIDKLYKYPNLILSITKSTNVKAVWCLRDGRSKIFLPLNQ